LAFAGPRSSRIDTRGWHMLVIFLSTIAALMLRPIPGGAAVIIGVTATVVSGVLPIQRALSAYGGPTVWQVISAFFIARALINTGLARRIALVFVRTIG